MPSQPYKLVPSPLHGYDNDCYIVALATFLRVPYKRAFEAIHRYPMPDPESSGYSLAFEMSLYRSRLRELGFVALRGKKYKHLRRTALVIAHHPNYPTLHAVVWDGARKRRVDPKGVDTLRRKHVVKMVFVRESRRLVF